MATFINQRSKMFNFLSYFICYFIYYVMPHLLHQNHTRYQQFIEKLDTQTIQSTKTKSDTKLNLQKTTYEHCIEKNGPSFNFSSCRLLWSLQILSVPFGSTFWVRLFFCCLCNVDVPLQWHRRLIEYQFFKGF